MSYALTPVVKRLLIANTAVFLVGLIVHQGYPGVFYEWFSFQPRNLLTRPWGALTYMFLHADFWHLFVNMLVLFFFGPPLEARWGSREFTRYYFLCGLGGVALSFAFMNAWVVGASAAVYGVMLAFAMNWPNAPIYVWGIFPIKAKVLVAILFAITLISAFTGPGGPVAHFAHLGGLAAGFIYLKLDWRPSQKLDRLRNPVTRVRRLAIVPRDDEDDEPGGAASSGSTSWGRIDERRLLDAVDRVLDKISAEGMSSLTSDEKRLLDEVSKRQRTD